MFAAVSTETGSSLSAIPWGSVLGLWLAHEHPERVSPYVGVGQVVDMQKNDFREPYCRPALIRAYEQQINGPRKDFVTLDNSGHFPFYEKKPKFAGELIRRVLPAAANRP